MLFSIKTLADCNRSQSRILVLEMEFCDLGLLQNPTLASRNVRSRNSLPIGNFSFFGCCLVVSAEEIDM